MAQLDIWFLLDEAATGAILDIGAKFDQVAYGEPILVVLVSIEFPQLVAIPVQLCNAFRGICQQFMQNVLELFSVFFVDRNYPQFIQDVLTLVVILVYMAVVQHPLTLA